MYSIRCYLHFDVVPPMRVRGVMYGYTHTLTYREREERERESVCVSTVSHYQYDG
jgi:hypothetical protein